MRLQELINKYYNQLNENDLHIWRYISSNKKECEKLSIDYLAQKCNVSKTTILRFAQKISLEGYSELKLYIKMENQRVRNSTNVIKMVCGNYNDVIREILSKDCTSIFKSMDSARNIYVYGVGMIQSSIKKELKRIFMSSGKILYDLGGYKEAEISLNIVGSQDLFIIVSVSGENKVINNFVSKLKVKNVPILSITKLKENTLSQMSNYRLYISSVTLLNESEVSYESITSYFILIEILFLKYMEYRKGRK